MINLKTMSRAVSGDSAPFMRTVRCRTVAKALSIGFDVRRCVQCSAGKSKNVNSASRSLSRQSTALSNLGDIFGEDRHRDFGGDAVLGQPDFAQIPMGVGLNRLRQLVENVQTLRCQHRWWRVEGNASSRAFQKPSAPSPTAMSGAIDRPRAFRSTSSSFQL